MDDALIRKLSRKISRPHRIERGAKFRLRDHDPASIGPFDADHEREAKELLAEGKETLARLQDMLYAQDRWSVLLIFQAMDAAGKDGAIKHVMSGINPQGCQVYSFKAPSREELDHDFLWRCVARAARARPHRHLQPQLLRGSAGREGAPGVPRRRRSCRRSSSASASGTSATRTSAASSATSRATARSSSSSSSTCRATSRRSASSSASTSRRRTGSSRPPTCASARTGTTYMDAYETMIRETAAPHAPWYVVPADNKWYTRIVVAGGDRRRARLARPALPEARQGASSPSSPRRARRWSRSGSRPARPMRFTVATYNIHKGFSHLTRRMVIHELRERLHGLAADILFLQEVQGVARSPRGALPRLAGASRSTSSSPTRCGTRSRTARTRSTAHGHHGNAVLSRFPIVAQENEDISAHAFESRGLLHCESSLGPRMPELHCLNVHLGLFERGRQWQIRALCERIKRDGAARRAAGHRRRLQRLAAQGRTGTLIDAARRVRGVRGGQGPPARTFPSVLPVFRLDRIYARGLDVVDARVHYAFPWRPHVRPRRARGHVRAAAQAALARGRASMNRFTPGQRASTCCAAAASTSRR